VKNNFQYLNNYQQQKCLLNIYNAQSRKTEQNKQCTWK